MCAPTGPHQHLPNPCFIATLAPTGDEVGDGGIKVAQEVEEGGGEEDGVVVHVQEPAVGVAKVGVGQEGHQACPCVPSIHGPVERHV